MAIYNCGRCNEYIDDDWHPCEEGPNNTLICPECYMILADEKEQEIAGEDYIKPRPKTLSFQEIARQEQQRVLAENESRYRGKR